MSISSSVIRELVHAGLSGEGLIEACERIEAASTPQKTRSAAAIRQERYRNNKASQSVTNRNSDVTVTNNPSPFPSPLSSPPTPPPIIPPTHTPTPKINAGAKKVGSRIPDEWHVGEIEFSEAIKIGLTRDQIQFESEQFRDHWSAKSGKDATKLDWLATWRTWCRNSVKYGKPRFQGQAPPKPKSEHVLRHEAFQREFDKVINGASNEPDSNIIDLAARDFRSYGAA